MESRPTASIIIIGDEILNGQTKDTNSHFLCQQLYACGVKVCLVSTVPDEPDVIAEEVLLQSNKFSFVITTGGIGPTHDDMTYEGIAKAFNEKLVLKSELQEAFRCLCHNLGYDDAAIDKLSLVPESSEIHHTKSNGNKLFLPIVSIKNVFIFPGIPSYLECTFSYLRDLFTWEYSCFHQRNLFINKNEFEITRILDKAVKKYKGRVKFGSYPDVKNDYYQVKLALEANSKDLLEEAEAYLRIFLPENSIVSPFPLKSYVSLGKFLEICDSNSGSSDLCSALKESIEILEESLKKFSINNICLSFNGGKDCTALLHLVSLFLMKKYNSKMSKLKVLYVHSNQSFPEVESFVKLSVKRYELDLMTYEPPIKNALLKMKIDHPEIQAIFMGTRHTDPYSSNLKPFNQTDGDWPEYMRISPLLHWSYPQVWEFLRSMGVPYCSLYDKGYTSLGCINNTLPNEKLLVSSEDGEAFYLPAYLLKDSNQEREGRNFCETKKKES